MDYTMGGSSTQSGFYEEDDEQMTMVRSGGVVMVPLSSSAYGSSISSSSTTSSTSSTSHHCYPAFGSLPQIHDIIRQRQPQQQYHLFPNCNWGWPSVPTTHNLEAGVVPHQPHEARQHQHQEQGGEQAAGSGISGSFYSTTDHHQGYSSGGRIRRREGANSEGAGTGGGGMMSGCIESQREHMFDKVVTPSDVGKLNRLVIPKQHAEKYFPLDSSTNEKGLLLNFEDRSGKPWRFRYSYWNSSQSYVMTKGWSRFVKEKKLDAGDIVSFHRGIGDSGKDRLYIDWRRRPDAPDPTAASSFSTLSLPHHFSSSSSSSSFRRSSFGWAPMFLRPPPATAAASIMPTVPWEHAQLQQQHQHLQRMNSGGYGGTGWSYGCSSNNGSTVKGASGDMSVIYSQAARSTAPQQGIAGMVEMEGVGVENDEDQEERMVCESVPVVQSKAAAASKRLRLFGVNMECCPNSESDDYCHLLSSSASASITNAIATTPLLPHATSTMPSSSSYGHRHEYASNSTSDNSLLLHPLQLRLYNGTSVPVPADKFWELRHPPPSTD